MTHDSTTPRPPNSPASVGIVPRRHTRARPGLVALLLTLLCLAAYLPGFAAIPVVDRDEARFAQASRQMLESDTLEGWVVPRLQDRPRLNKPPVIYWLQAASVAAFTGGNPEADRIWMYRVPSLLAAIVTVLITWRLGTVMFGRRAGALAGGLMALAPVFVWEANQARSDQVMIAFTMIAMWALWRIWMFAHPAQNADAQSTQRARPGWLLPLVFWLAVGAGIMTKGPITPMVAGMTALTASLVARQWAWLLGLRPLVGLGIVVLCVAPWVLAVVHSVGFERYTLEIYDEVLGRSMTPAEGHWGPPGYHLLLFIVLFWPGSALTGIAVAHACKLAARRRSSAEAATTGGRLRRCARAWRDRGLRHPGALFCLAWLLPSWIVFELVSTKLPHYTMPLYPAAAILTAAGLVRAARGRLPAATGRAAVVGYTLWLGAGAVITAGSLTAISIINLQPVGAGAVPAVPIAIGLTAGVLCLAGLWHVRRCLMAHRFVRATIAAGGVTLLWGVVLLQITFPSTDTAWISPRIMTVIDVHDPDGQRPIGSVRFHEDSLLFLTRGRLDRLNADEWEDWLDRHPDGLLVLPRDETAGNDGLEVLGQVRGFNYSNGRSMKLIIVERQK